MNEASKAHALAADWHKKAADEHDRLGASGGAHNHAVYPHIQAAELHSKLASEYAKHV